MVLMMRCKRGGLMTDEQLEFLIDLVEDKLDSLYLDYSYEPKGSVRVEIQKDIEAVKDVLYELNNNPNSK